MRRRTPLLVAVVAALVMVTGALPGLASHDFEDVPDNNIFHGDIEWLKGLIIGVRNIRAEMNIGPGKPLELLLRKANSEDQRRLNENEAFLKKLAKLSSITLLGESDEAPLSATALVGELEVLVPMAGLIDKAQELARLDRELERLDTELARLVAKLENPAFAEKAPAEVVAKEESKRAEFADRITAIRAQLAELG